MEYVKLLDTNIDSNQIWQELYPILEAHDLLDVPQVGLTSLSGNDWFDCVGKISDLRHPEKYYSTVNTPLKNTVVERIINHYSSFYRWRLLKINPKQTYSIHKDAFSEKHINLRLHIPLITNPHAFLCFYKDAPVPGKDVTVRHEHLKEDCSYIVNTSGLHTAVNYGTTHRYHIVGVKYENSNNRT